MVLNKRSQHESGPWKHIICLQFAANAYTIILPEKNFTIKKTKKINDDKEAQTSAPWLAKSSRIKGKLRRTGPVTPRIHVQFADLSCIPIGSCPSVKPPLLPRSTTVPSQCPVEGFIQLPYGKGGFGTPGASTCSNPMDQIHSQWQTRNHSSNVSFALAHTSTYMR